MRSNPTILHINLFFFQIEKTCTFMNISSLKYHQSVKIKAENSFVSKRWWGFWRGSQNFLKGFWEGGMEIILKAGREMPIFLDAIERLSICNIILLITKPLHKWVICSFLFSISITKLQCPLLCAVISSIYIIIITFIFTLLLLIMLQTVFIVILIIIIAIINIKN